jgi:glyoxylate/hydroxypyruvate reductase A
MNVYLCGRWDEPERDAWLRALRDMLAPRHRLLLARGEVDDAAVEVAVVANPPPGSLAGLPNLRLIQSLWAGVDRLLADATLPAAVPVARMVDPAMNAAMAETALWAVLSLHRGFFDYAQQQQRGVWQQAAQRRADEVPVLVLGFGQMGRAAARRIAQLGYPVTAWSRLPATQCEPGVVCSHGEAALEPAAARSCIIVNLLPLTAHTQGILGARLFGSLMPGTSIVNLARGAHLVEPDLLDALRTGTVGRAVLDVFQAEPLSADHPFWRHPRITVLPHVAALTDARSAAAVVARNIDALAEARPLAHLVERARGY